jgi:type II secretory pathway pseudopilin PulG
MIKLNKHLQVLMPNNSSGFTIVEIIVSALMLAIVVAGVFAAFVSATKLAGFFRHDVQAVINGGAYLDSTRAQQDHYNNTPIAIDVTNWPLNTEVDDLASNTTPTITYEDLGSSNVAAGYNYDFKKTEAIIKWYERDI